VQTVSNLNDSPDFAFMQFSGPPVSYYLHELVVFLAADLHGWLQFCWNCGRDSAVLEACHLHMLRVLFDLPRGTDVVIGMCNYRHV
jgi:hypothetical protein